MDCETTSLAKRKKCQSSLSTRSPKRVGLIEEIIEKNPHFKVVKVDGYGMKIRCTLTGHEMKKDADVLNKYLTSKSYQHAVQGWYDDSKFEEYLPYIVPHKANERKLFCKVTKQELNKVPAQVAKHVKGKKFKKNKVLFDEKAVQKSKKDESMEVEEQSQ